MSDEPKLYLHHPRFVPRTNSTLPKYRDFFPAKKSIKEFFDANPIDKMDLDTARKIYDRCVKHHLGCFVPGHHPDDMTLQELVPKLKIEHRNILSEYPEAQNQSERIKMSLEQIAEARKHLPKRLYLHKDFPIKHLVGLTKEQLEAMIHNHYVKDRKTPPDFKHTSKESLMLDFTYEVFLLKQAANELNVPATSNALDADLDYTYSEAELHGCDGYVPRTLVITPKFPLKCLPALSRTQMEAMLQNHYAKNNIDIPDFDNMNDTVLRSRIHLAVAGQLPNLTDANNNNDPKWPSSITTTTMETQPACPSPTKKQKQESFTTDVDMDNETNSNDLEPTSDQSLLASIDGENSESNIVINDGKTNTDKSTHVVTQTEDEISDNCNKNDTATLNLDKTMADVIAQHSGEVDQLKNMTDDDILLLTHENTLLFLFPYATEKCVQFVGSSYNTTPVEILRRYVHIARDILNGKSKATILDDDLVLNNMALLDDDSIFCLNNDEVDEYLSTYARQYNVVVDKDYYTKTCIEQKRVQLTKTLHEYKQKFLKHEPITSLNEHSTDHMIDCASLNMIKTMLKNYIDSLDVAVEMSSFTNLSHPALNLECKKIRNKLREEYNLPPVESALPSNQPTELQKSVGNKNGNLFSKYILKSTTYLD